jgi:phosphate-selective porin OprO/OprP
MNIPARAMPAFFVRSAALGLTALCCALPAAAQEQGRLPPVESDAIHERLDEQAAEIARLRQELAATRTPEAPQPDDGQANVIPTYPTANFSQFESVLNRLEQLEKENAKAKEDKAKSKEKDKEKKDDEWKDMSKDKWTVKMGGHVQLDYINWAASDPTVPNQQDYFEFRRIRLTADGTGYGQYDFRLQMTLEPETVGESNGQATSPDVKDAYLSANDVPLLGRWRIGNFFVPFGLEQVTNDTMNMFMERSIPTQGIFTADREVGMAFYNCTADQNVTWCGGIFFDSISDTLKERIDDNQGYRMSGRATYLPYYDEPSGGRYLVHTGIGVLYTQDQDRSVRFRARPQIHEGPRLIDSGAIAADSYTTGNLEGAIVWGNVTLQTEAYLSNVNRLIGDNVTVGGAYAHLSYFLTGENRIYERFGQHGAQFGRNQPYTNFFAVPGCVGSGAWEAKARWSNLNLTNLNAGQYNDMTLGFNWYWTDRVRVMFDYIHPITNDTNVGDTTSDILAMRYDFNW